MKNNMQFLKFATLFILGSLSVYSCSNSKSEKEPETSNVDDTEVVELEEIPEPNIDFDWAGDLKSWIVSGEGMKSITLDKITGEGEITSEGRTQLDLVAAILESNPTIKCEIQGHSASNGKPAQEKIGSAARAEWTRLKLIFGHDAISQNVSAKGYGSENPIEGIDPADDRQKRVVILLSK